MAGSVQSNETIDDRKVALAPLLKILECSVCLEVVKIPFKECNRGHLICSECMKSLSKCPTCKAAVFQENPVRVKNLLEALLKSCRYSDRGCCRCIEPRADHEAFCEYRDVPCMIEKCHVTPLATQLKRHLQNDHDSVQLFDSPNGTIKIEQFQPNGLVLYFSSMLVPVKLSHLPVFALDTFFWLKTTLDRISGYLELQFRAVFLGGPVFDYFIDVKFDRANTGILYTLRASTGAHPQTDEENGSAVKILSSSLRRFADDQGSLAFTYQIYTKQTKHS